jgi:hypothetical protein
MGRGVGVELVGQRELGVRLAVELATIEVEQLRVVLRAVRHDARQLGTHHFQGQLPRGTLGRVTRRTEPQRPGVATGCAPAPDPVDFLERPAHSGAS